MAAKFARVSSLSCILLLGSCAVFGPIIDRRMDRAPYAACADVATEARGAKDCLDVSVARKSGPPVAGPLTLVTGDKLIATPSSKPGCRGDYTHVVLTGQTRGNGSMTIEVDDAFARGTVSKAFRWDRSQDDQTWVSAGIGSAIMQPSRITVEVLKGEMLPQTLCFKSYHS